MDDVLLKLQREAERIASRHPIPEFYARCRASVALARKIYYNHPTVVLLRKEVSKTLREDMGHGMYHSDRVSLDCAAIIHVESEGGHLPPGRTQRLMVLGLVAGLLHDIRRQSERHAVAGAEEAARVLNGYELSKVEALCVCEAIRNHEAFVPPVPSTIDWYRLVSDSLYDADKFRWGADTFTHTLWHMMDIQGLSPSEIVERFPWGMKGVYRIMETFRTPTGRQYGPEIIEAGVQIGKEIYRYLLQYTREHEDRTS